jgi:hypothetical protein
MEGRPVYSALARPLPSSSSLDRARPHPRRRVRCRRQCSEISLTDITVNDCRNRIGGTQCSFKARLQILGVESASG